MALSYLVITENKTLMPYCQVYSVKGFLKSFQNVPTPTKRCAVVCYFSYN